MDISLVQEKSFGRSKYWLLTINDAMDFCFSKFMKSKDQMSATMVSLIQDLKNEEGIVVKKICCDNAGENIAFQQNTKKEGLGLNFEFTAHVTPQQNGRVKCKFATLFRRVWLMLNLAGLVGTSKDLHKGLWAECADTTTKMENVVVKSDKEPPYCQFLRRTLCLFICFKHLERLASFMMPRKINGKLKNQGMIGMFVSHAANHARDKFEMLNLKTKRIWQSQDVWWIAPSLLAYTTLQLDCIKAGKNKDDDDDDDPSLKMQPIAATNHLPLVNQEDANNDVDNNALDDHNDAPDEDYDALDEDDDHPPV